MDTGLMLQRSIVMALLMLLATPAAAEWHPPCLFGLLGGCSLSIVASNTKAPQVRAKKPSRHSA
jgi:hypothetical protein